MGKLNYIEHQLPKDFNAHVVKEIRSRLNLVREQGATVLFAIESGSRAWGFPSPDSDYDCRFIYSRPVEDHLLLKPMRDVIEFPIEGDVDTGGWDLKKALLLALGGNAAICEWVDSVICYEEVPNIRSEFKTVLKEITNPVDVAHHYLGLARSGIERHEVLSGEIKLKKLFYILRPLIALQWMKDRDFKIIPYMNFNHNLSEINMQKETREEITALLEKKKITKEIGSDYIPPAIKQYIINTFENFDNALPKSDKSALLKQKRLDVAQEFYSSVINSKI